MATIPASQVVKGMVVRFKPVGLLPITFTVDDVGELDGKWAKLYGFRAKPDDDGYGNPTYTSYGNRTMHLVRLDGECEVLHTWPKTAAAKWPDRIEDDKGFVVVDAVTGKGLGWFASMEEAQAAKAEAGVANVYRSDEYRQGWVGRHFGSKTGALRIGNQWNGEFEDGEVDRPGGQPLDYVIQRDETGYVWMTMSHLKMTPIARGVADSIDAARAAIEASSPGVTAARTQFGDFERGQRVTVRDHPDEPGTIVAIRGQGNAYTAGYIQISFDSDPGRLAWYPWRDVFVTKVGSKTAASRQDIGFNMSKFFYWGTTDIGLVEAKSSGEIRDGNDKFVIVSTRFEDMADSPVVVSMALPVTWLWDNIDPDVREMCPNQQEFFRIMGRWSGELNVLAPIPARYLKPMGKASALFNPSQMASWESSRPWNLTRQDAEAQMVDGWWHSDTRGTESASWDGRYIRPTDDFYHWPEGVRRAIAYHEAGHAMLQAAGGLSAIGGDPLEIIEWPGARGLSYNAEEIIAEAYSVLWTEPSWFVGRAEQIRDLVIGLARRAGFPVPG